MKGRKHSYKETKAYVKRKRNLLKSSANVGNITDRRKFIEAVQKANINTLSRLESTYERYTEGYINARQAWNNVALNMRQWAVIKRYYDLVDEGKIQPRLYELDNYEKYATIEAELSLEEMLELTAQAERQTEIRIERLNRKAKRLTEESMASFEEGARMLGIIPLG